MDRYVEAERGLNGIPGIAVAVFAGGGEVRGYGLAVDQPVELASLSKSLTAIAVLNLVRNGHVNWDDPVSRHLPAFAPDRHLTIRHLLRQTSGFQRDDDYRIPCCAALGHFTLPQTATTLGAVKRPATPAGFVYANSNYMLLAALVERTSGQPFAAFLSQSVLDPLGMTQTSFSAVVAQYQPAWGRLRPAPPESSSWHGSSRLRSTAADMGRYLSHLLGESSPFGDWLEPDPQPGYDMGWFVRPHAAWLDGELVLEHTGYIWSGSTAAVVAPRRGLGVVVLTNAGIPRAGAIARNILAGLAGGREPMAVRSSPWESPDFWGILLTTAGLLMFVATGWRVHRALRDLRSGRRAWDHLSKARRVRATLLTVLAAALIVIVLGPSMPPIVCLPPAAQVALPLFVAAAVTVLLTAAVLGLSPRRA